MTAPDRPRKAFVLAAGFGTRMLPLTRTVPKPLLPFWGKPLLVRTLEMLRAWGVREVCINVHHLPEAIIEHLARHPVRGLAIGYSREEEILGTGGALPHAKWFLEDGGPFWMVNADVVMQLDPEPLLRAFAGSSGIPVAAGGRRGDRKAAAPCLAACWLHGSRGPRTVEMAHGVIGSFRSSRAKTDGTFTFCGVQLLSPRILDFLPPSGFSTIVEGYEAAMKAGHRIAGVEIPSSFWADVGTPQQYLGAHREWPGRPARFVAKGGDVTIARGAKVRDSVLWSGASIGPHAVVRDAIVGNSCTVDFPLTGSLALRACDALAPPECALLRTAGWPATATAVPLGPRGSNRSFTRIWRDGGPPSIAASAILIHYDPVRVENPLYARHARFLAATGFPVPRVLADDPKRCVTLLEDLGDASILATMQDAGEASVEAVYRRVLDAILVLHGRSSRAARRRKLAMVPAFRPRLYQWERDYFAEHMLEKRCGLPAAEIRAIKNDLKKIGRRLLRAPPVVVHRDLQSSNVILQHGRPHFIDFQGMRWGPAAYDLASLLCDPYMELPEALQVRLLDYYAERCGDPAVRDLFWPAAVQRLAQALGAFARLGAAQATHAFAGHIPAALRMMSRALAHVRGLPHLRAWVAAAGRA